MPRSKASLEKKKLKTLYDSEEEKPKKKAITPNSPYFLKVRDSQRESGYGTSRNPRQNGGHRKNFTNDI